MDTGITHTSDSAMGQEVGEPLCVTTGNSGRARKEDSPDNNAMISTTPQMSRQQTRKEFQYHQADAQYVARLALVQGLLAD